MDIRTILSLLWFWNSWYFAFIAQSRHSPKSSTWLWLEWDENKKSWQTSIARQTNLSSIMHFTVLLSFAVVGIIREGNVCCCCCCSRWWPVIHFSTTAKTNLAHSFSRALDNIPIWWILNVFIFSFGCRCCSNVWFWPLYVWVCVMYRSVLFPAYNSAVA